MLDCCTGTADLALAYDRASRGRSPVIGTDFCHEMLRLGHGKVKKAGASDRIVLVEGDTRPPTPAERYLRDRDGGLRPAERERHGARGIDEMISGRPPRWEGRDPRIPRVPGAPARPALSCLLPPRTSQSRPDDCSQSARRLQLPAVERSPIPRRTGDARPAQLPGPERDPALSLDLRNRDPLRRDQAAPRCSRMSAIPLPPRLRAGDDRRERLPLCRGAFARLEPVRAHRPPDDQREWCASAPGGAGHPGLARELRCLGVRRDRRPRVVYHHHKDFSAGIASGSFRTAGMVVALAA